MSTPAFENLVVAAERAVLIAQGIWPGSGDVLDMLADDEWDQIRAAAPRPRVDPAALAAVEAGLKARLPGRPARDERDKGRLTLFAGRQFSALPPKLARAACHAWALANTGFSEDEIGAYLDMAERRR